MPAPRLLVCTFALMSLIFGPAGCQDKKSAASRSHVESVTTATATATTATANSSAIADSTHAAHQTESSEDPELRAWLGDAPKLVHVAGRGGELADGASAWQAEYEDGPALEAGFSQPYTAQADDHGNIYVADKNGHAIRKISADGRLVTWGGTGVVGDGSDDPGPATSRALSSPNGMVVWPDGTVFVLDRDNGKIRRIDPEGQMRTVAKFGSKFDTGRGLAVTPQATAIYVAAKDKLLRWTAKDGFQTFAEGFASLGNLALRPDQSLLVADRGANRVIVVDAQGKSQPLAGNGDTRPVRSGLAASDLGLAGPRGIVALDGQRFVVATQEGRQVWYFGHDGKARLILDGRDGQGAVRTQADQFGPLRGLALTPKGDLLITHGNGGQVHRLELAH